MEPETFSFLPADILRIIQQFCGAKDFLNFLNGNRALRERIREIIQLRLTQEYSKLFITDQSFFKRVRAMITSPSQLSLNLDGIDFASVTLFSSEAVSNVYSISLQGCTNLPPLSLFQNIHSLNFSHCRGLTSIQGLPRGIHTVSFNCCYNLGDVSPLADCEVVSLRGCSNIFEVSTLGKVKYLDLSWNANLTDCNGLGLDQEVLDLSFCPKLRNVSSLQRVRKLNLNFCPLVEGVESLQDRVSFISAINT